MWHGLNGEALTSEEANKLLGDKRRIIAKTMIRNGRERIGVSTVFLVLDHGFLEPHPVLWDTIVFGGSEDGVQMRYQSRDGALCGHRAMVGMIRMTIEIEQYFRARRRRLHTAYRARRA